MAAASAPAASPAAGFATPPVFEFPPFFTLQPVDATRGKQLQEWRKLVIDWAASTRTSTLVVTSWPLWENPRIARRLAADGIAAVVQHLIDTGCAEWADPASRTTLRVFYRSPAEWGALLHAHMQQYGYTGQVLTLYECHSGAPALGTPWQGLDPAVLLRALETLEAAGKASLIRAEAMDETAVRFL